MRLFIINIWIVAFMSACHSQSSTPKTKNYHEVVVTEVLQANSYTYLHLKENDAEERWVALPKMTAEVGETYYYKGGFMMKDFKSKDLNRTFEEVYFLEGISKEPITEEREAKKAVQPHATTPQAATPDNLPIHKVVVVEEVQANNYTYLRVSENEAEHWVALPKTKTEIGGTYYYKEGFLMSDFESKDLGRTFKEVYFITGVSAEPITQGATTPQNNANAKKPQIEKTNVKIEPDKDGITIAQLYSDMDAYANKVVKIKGQVTKYNAQIMGKNWIHIQDGTQDGEHMDLTITTAEIANIGDVITVEGKITLNKDFGAGYFYEIIMEDAKIKK